MMNKGLLFTLTFLVSAGFSQMLYAETKYVSDQLSVNMRSGPTNEYRFLGRIDSGAKVEVLEEDAANGSTKVRTERGSEVWIQSKYLMSEPSAREQLTAMETNFRQLENQYRQEISELKNQLAAIQDVRQHNQELVLENTKLEQQLELVNQQNTRLADRSSTDFMQIGAGILVIGFVFGWLITKFGGNKRDRGWS